MNIAPGVFSTVPYATAALPHSDFRRLSALIHSQCGIKMPDAKKVMLEARLRKRLRALVISSFREYCDFLFSPEGMQQELPEMINAVTTNKTDFFREPRHFDFLVGSALPDLMPACGTGMRRGLKIWSAGCSTGEEPYTIAMALANARDENYPGLDFSIEATDICTRALAYAKRGVYKAERTAPVPACLKKKFLMRSKDKSSELVRVAPEVRAMVAFRKLNLMDRDFGFDAPVDIIFCRNVIIYFDRPTQEKLLGRLCANLLPGGYLFMGHSETLNGLSMPLMSVGPMVYKKAP